MAEPELQLDNQSKAKKLEKEKETVEPTTTATTDAPTITTVTDADYVYGIPEAASAAAYGHLVPEDVRTQVECNVISRIPIPSDLECTANRADSTINETSAVIQCRTPLMDCICICSGAERHGGGHVRCKSNLEHWSSC